MKIAIALALFFAAVVAQPSIGIVQLRGTSNDPNIKGVIVFYLEDNGNVTMAVNISGITVNTGAAHGMHVHQYGDLRTTDGNSVGSHLNPFNAVHGCDNTDNRHLGDTGDWNVGADGTIVANKSLDLMTLMGTNHSIIGGGFILHEKTDDCLNTTSAGKRLAQGVVGIANPSPFGATQNLAAPSPIGQSPLGSTVQAVCVLQGATPQSSGATAVSGQVYFSQTSNGIAVSATIYGLADTRPRGFHIHQWGDLTNGTGAAAGPHWTGVLSNGSAPHSIPGSGNPGHIGDMGNVFVYDSNGTAYYYNVLSTFGIYNNIDSVLGRAIVVHNLTDDCTGTNGNAGARIAHCVIGVANPQYSGNQTVLSEVESAQNVSFCPKATTGLATGAMTTGGNGTMTSAGDLTTAAMTTHKKASSTSGRVSGAEMIICSFFLLVATMLIA